MASELSEIAGSRGPGRTVARQEALPVADGPDRAHRGAGDAADRLGAQPVRLARGRAGAVLDRPDPGVHRAAAARLAVRARRGEPARRGDGAAGERQVLPLLHLQLHPVPVRDRRPGRLPVHRVRPELARVRRLAGLAGQDRPGAVGRHDGRRRHQHRARTGPQEGLARALAGQDHAGADLLRPLLHRAQPRPPRARRHPGGPRVGPLRRDVLGVPAAQRVGQPEVVVGARGAAAAQAGQEPVASGPTTC